MPNPYSCLQAPKRKRRFDECDSENARVRSVIYYEKGNVFPRGTATENANFFKTLEAAGKAFVVRDTSGNYDGSSATMGPGRGDVAERITGRAHGLQYQDAEYIGNEDYYNKISALARDYNFAWTTESRVWPIEDNTILIDPTNPHADDVNAEVVALVNVKWNKKELPISYPIDREILREIPELAFVSLTKNGAGAEVVDGTTVTAAAASAIDVTVSFTGAVKYLVAPGSALPAGMSLNELTGKITGSIAAPGSYFVVIVGENQFGIDGEQEIRFSIVPV